MGLKHTYVAYFKSHLELFVGDTHAAISVEATEQLYDVDVVFLAVLFHGVHRVLDNVVAFQPSLPVRVGVTVATAEFRVDLVQFR